MGCFKVNFCAAPSSGKSTVCSGLESLLKQNNINADTSKEYVRQFIQTYGVGVNPIFPIVSKTYIRL